MEHLSDPKLIAIIALSLAVIIEGLLLWKKSKQTKIVKVENKDQKFGANDHYWFVKLSHNGKKQPLLFTDDQLGDATERATKNPEDIPK